MTGTELSVEQFSMLKIGLSAILMLVALIVCKIFESGNGISDSCYGSGRFGCNYTAGRVAEGKGEETKKSYLRQQVT